MEFEDLKLTTALVAAKAVIQDQDKEIERLNKTIDNLKKTLYSGLECDTLEEWKNKISQALRYYVDCMTAAYMTETNIPPSKVVLCTSTTDDGKSIKYFFEDGPKPEPTMRIPL